MGEGEFHHSQAEAVTDFPEIHSKSVWKWDTFKNGQETQAEAPGTGHAQKYDVVQWKSETRAHDRPAG